MGNTSSKGEKSLFIEHLTTGYPNKTISEDLCLSLENGTLAALIGPNGSGKSTLLSAIAFGDTRRKGAVYINGTNSASLSPSRRARLVSIVMSRFAYDPHITVEELIAIGRTPYLNTLGTLKHEDKMIIRKAIVDCGLRGFERRSLTTLSDGERQRVLIARALAQETPLVLLDEPTAHLDLSFRAELFLLLGELARSSGRTFLVSTHEIHLAMQWCERLWLIDKKGTLTDGVPEELALNGTLSGVFDSESFCFNPLSGQIDLPERQGRSIKLEGKEDERLEWTRRFLKRLGYNTSSNGEIGLIVGENNWLLQHTGVNTTLSSLNDLQEQLVSRRTY